MPQRTPQPSSNRLQPAGNSGVGGSRLKPIKSPIWLEMDAPIDYALASGWQANTT
jgi:hypothetical protein